MKVLDLFSGIGGFSLGLERSGFETVAFCEYDDKCRQVLTKHWPDVPQYTDVRELTGEQLERDGITDIGLICGGYPCQPFSHAGKRQGEDDDRHLWPEAFRLVRELKPNWCVFENVAGHINMGLERVLADLESEGYQQQVFLISACAVDAKHRRDRVWIVAHSECGSRRSSRHKQDIQQANPGLRTQDSDDTENASIGPETMANPESQRRRETGTDSQRPKERITSSSVVADSHSVHAQRFSDRQREIQPGGSCRWTVEPAVGRVANGIPGRVDRLKQLGNAVVPQVVEVIGRAIMEAR